MLNRTRKNTKAQAVVELALILPVLMLLVMGIVEFGRIFMAQQTITNASREGARTGVLPTSTVSDVEQTVQMYLRSAGLNGATSVISSNVGPTTQPGSPTSVTVRYALPVLTGTIIPVLGDSVKLSHTTVMRHE